MCRENEDQKFKKNLGNRKLLWHGSRITNFVGILSQGLRIAPPEAPSSGYLFGKGVYFADMASKSVGYCCPTKNTALILLCEVALGNMNELTTTNHNANNLPNGKHSTKGCGVTYPHPEESLKVDGIEIPLGKPTKSKENKVISLFVIYFKKNYFFYQILFNLKFQNEIFLFILIHFRHTLDTMNILFIILIKLE